MTENLECEREKTYYFGVKVINSNMHDLSTIKFDISHKNGTNSIEGLTHIQDATILGEDPKLCRVYEFTMPESNMSETYSITASVGLNKYTISLDTKATLADGETVKDNLPEVYYYIENEDTDIKKIEDVEVEYGTSAKFKIYIPDVYSHSNFKVRYYDENNEAREIVTGKDEYYVIYNVHGHLTVKVEDLKWSRYAVIFPNTEGLKFMVKNDSGE